MRSIELMRLEAYADKFVGELSTGTRRVVDLACTLAHRPSVLLLDEPSSGIAQRETEALGPVLLDIRDKTGAAMVVIEHDMPLISGISDELPRARAGIGRGLRTARGGAPRPTRRRGLPGHDRGDDHAVGGGPARSGPPAGLRPRRRRRSRSRRRPRRPRRPRPRPPDGEPMRSARWLTAAAATLASRRPRRLVGARGPRREQSADRGDRMVVTRPARPARDQRRLRHRVGARAGAERGRPAHRSQR